MIAAIYYRKIIAATKSDDQLQILSIISHANCNDNTHQLEKARERTVNWLSQNPHATADEKAEVATTLFNILPAFQRTEILRPYSYLSDKIKNKRVKFIFLTKLIISFSESHSEEVKLLEEPFLQTFNDINDKELESLYFYISAKIYKTKRQYEKYHAEAEKSMIKKFGDFSSSSQLLENLRINNTSPADYKYILDYANANLFLTRANKGIEPVKKAFKIYDLILSDRLKSKTKSVSLFVSSKVSHNESFMLNPLIIGTYLSQEENDISYLKKAIQITDAYTGSSLHFWLPTRRKMRLSPEFSLLMAKDQETAKIIKYASTEITVNQIRKINQSFKAKRKEMSEKFSEHFDNIEKEFTLNFDTLQKELSTSNTSVIGFYTFGVGFYRLMITADTTQISVLTSKFKQTADLATKLPRRLASIDRSDSLKLESRQLFQLLFKGIDTLLSEEIHIIANGVLENIPFSALRMDTVGTTPRYLGVEHAVSRQFSIRSMQMLNDLSYAPKYQRIFGMAPDFSNAPSARDEQTDMNYRLPPLTFNKTEIDGLAATNDGLFLRGDRADRDAFLANAPDYGVIHLASHALSSRTDGLRSRIYLSDGEGGHAELYASDIGDRTLNAGLVTLSACETGAGGRHAIEGTVGLNRAFLAAGARSVVASQWAVDDRATSDLMRDFYAGLNVGQPPHKALRDARRRFLDRSPDAHPYEWAAFEAYGGTRPLQLEAARRANRWPYGLAALAALLAIIGGRWWWLRRHGGAVRG